MAILDSSFYMRNTVDVAIDLLGKYLVRNADGQLLVCRITETEAYIGAIDKACHAYGGKITPRTKTLYAAPGTAYVYLIYGMYSCVNFVTEPEGVASAVLIRSGVPVYNEELISQNRFGKETADLSSYQRKNFMNGPGKLCKGLLIDKSLNNVPCGSNLLYIADELPELGLFCRNKHFLYESGKRIGIDYAEEAADFPWRFWITEDY